MVSRTTLRYSLNRCRCSVPFEAMAFRADSPFFVFSVVASTCSLNVSILSKCTPRYLSLLNLSMTSSLNLALGLDLHAALLSSVHQRACAFVGLMVDMVSWHHCDVLFSCSWTAATASGVLFVVLYTRPSSARVSTRAGPWASKSANPLVYTLYKTSQQCLVLQTEQLSYP